MKEYICFPVLAAGFVLLSHSSLYCLDGEDVVIENGTFSWSAEGPPCLKRYVLSMCLYVLEKEDWKKKSTTE